MEGKRVVLLVTGSIAVYKAVELVRMLVKRGADVHVVMTKGACEFVTPLTFQAISGNPVRTEMFMVEQECTISHIDIAERADVVVIAPATANVIAKVRAGMADDLCTAIALACPAPMVIAPAMNFHMWENVATKDNIVELYKRGLHIVEPEHGELACGSTGKGRLADLDVITIAIERALREQDLRGSLVIVTTGATREFIDPVRFVSNRSSGLMGIELAKEAYSRGADVVLVKGQCSVDIPSCINKREVTTAREMQKEVNGLLNTCNVEISSVQGGASSVRYRACLLFMAAAVCDHRPALEEIKKIKSTKGIPYALELAPNPDILEGIGVGRESLEQKLRCPFVLVGFAAETCQKEELYEFAKDKLQKKNCDIVVANLAGDSFEKATNCVSIVDREGDCYDCDTAPKSVIARHVVDRAVKFLE